MDRFALLSAGGSSVTASGASRDHLAVGTTDGIWFLQRDAEGFWSLLRKALPGTFVSALAWTEDGALIAGTHHFGLARSDDNGATWTWINKGLSQFDVWVVKVGRLRGKETILAGTMPVGLFASEDGGASWHELSAIKDAPTAQGWFFPPPPHLGHVKDIAVQGDDLLVGIEVGALLRSKDGTTFEELPVAAEFTDIDIHRIIVHPARPSTLIVATGWGVKRSDDSGATWQAVEAEEINYPDAMVSHPADPDLLFVAGAKGYPPNWYKINRARPRLARSRDGGRTWERLLGGFPNGQRAAIGGMTLATTPAGDALFVGDTDGQIFESRDNGDTWEMIFETGAVSKGEHYRGLAKGRPPMSDLDNLTFAPAGQRRVDTAKGVTMIVEQRRYTLKPFQIKDYFRIYEKDGLPVQTRHFPRMIGYFHTEVGPLNEVIHMWGFDTFEHRLQCRAALAADPDWQIYAVQTRPMIEKQESWLLNPAPFSPIR